MRFKTFKYFINEEYQDKIPGGKGDDIKPADVDSQELAVGIEVEKEHVGNDIERAKEISIDHLTENPKYYSKLILSGIVDEAPAIALAKKYGWPLNK